MEETSLPSTNVITRELCKVEKFECSAQSRMAKRKLTNTKQNKDKQHMIRKMRIITSASAASILACGVGPGDKQQRSGRRKTLGPSRGPRNAGRAAWLREEGQRPHRDGSQKQPK